RGRMCAPGGKKNRNREGSPLREPPAVRTPVVRASRALSVAARPPSRLQVPWDRLCRAAGFPEKTVRGGGFAVRIRRGTWDEAFVTRAIEQREYNPPGYEIQPGDTVVDVGANVGTFALLASRAAGPSGRVVACEPDPENFALLLRNLRDNGCANVIPAKVAVAGVAGKLTLHSGEQGGFHSLYAARLPGSPRSCEVEALTLADVFDRFGVGRCDFLKVDCEGAEFEIFPALPEGHW